MDEYTTKKIKQILDSRGMTAEIITFDRSTRTAQEAAAALNCQTGQIAKSLIFKKSGTEEAVLVVTSGKNRVDNDIFLANTGLKLDKADAGFCEQVTGFSIGGIPPFGHKSVIPTYIDLTLLDYDRIWASAGGPNSVFETSPEMLLSLTHGQLVRVG